MASTGTDDPSPTELVEPQIGGCGSTQSEPQITHEQEPINSADLQSTDEAEQGEKRKREDPDPTQNPLWKTSLCSYFRRTGGACSHGDECKFAHGEEELRPRPDNSWDQTSERAKKLKCDANEKEEEEEEEVLMTDMVVDGEETGDLELRKCLVHLPRKWSSDQIRKFLEEQGIPFKSAKKKKGMTVGFVTFESVEQMKGAIEELEGKCIGNKNVKVADVMPRSFERSKSENGAGDSSKDDIVNGDGSTPEASVSRGRSARDAVTPLSHMPYSDQLEHKKNSIKQILIKLTRNARKACPKGVSLPEWVLKSRELGGLPCELEGIIQSPVLNGYRNKCEFSVGYSREGKPTVGFNLGNFREGVTAVEEPLDCPNVSKIARIYASIFQEFLQHSSLPLWNRFENTGFWRQLTVREGRSAEKVADEQENINVSEVMLMVQACTTGFDDATINSEFERMSQAFVAAGAASSPCLPLTALVVQDHQGISNVAPPDAPLRILPIPKDGNGSEPVASDNASEARIYDHISNLKFSISPTAFFQVNTLAAEKLYSLAGDWAQLGPDTLLFDVCCGTGTIGLTLAHRVGMVIGIEMNASAVSDAMRNAEINGIKNCRFVCAKAEVVIASLLKEYLNVSQKQDQPLAGDEESVSSENKDSLMGNGQSAEENSIHEPGKQQDRSGNSENGGQELENQLQNNNSVEEEGYSMSQQFKNVVAIVDPPRMGLHPTVTKVLRTHSHLRRLVYISCNPESLVANAIELCTPSQPAEKPNKDNRNWRKMSSAGLARHRLKSMPDSEPFRPVKAMAVDLFPHTLHCEMVMLLER